MMQFIMFPPDATDFTRGGYRIITPTAATYTIELTGAGSLHIEHPIDAEGKWRTLTNGQIILAPVYRRGEEFPQPFRIYKVTKSRKSGVPVVTVDALHLFYDLNYTVFPPNEVTTLDSTVSGWLSSFYTWANSEFSFFWNHDTDYWSPSINRFTFSTNIPDTGSGGSDNTFNFTINGGTVVEHLVGSADSVLKTVKGELLCDGLTVNIDKAGTHTRANAFRIAYGLNLDGITQTVDDSQVITLLYPDTNLEGVGLAYPNPGAKFADMGYPFSRIAAVEFNYQLDETKTSATALWNKFLKTDAPGYFTRRSTPNVTYSVDLKAKQIADEVKNIATFEVGDSGMITDPELDISTTQMIVSKTVDLLKQQVTAVELSNNQKGAFLTDWSGIVSSGQSSIERRVKSN